MRSTPGWHVWPARGTGALAVLLACLLSWPSNADDAVLHIGSKRFTESYVLGEVLRARAASAGPVDYRAGLGNTTILLAALRSGEIDVYPEYTGTIAREILGRSDLVTPDQMAPALASLGLGVGVPLGFSDAYALAVPLATARRLQLAAIGDLAGAAGIRLAFSHEFLERRDGWPAIAHQYGLSALKPQGLDHGLAYQALASGAVDVVDAYTTDARLAGGGLILLSDPAHVIPPYDAVLLFRIDAPARHPAQWQAMAGLQGRISEPAMRRANARVDLDHVPYAEAAHELLAGLEAGSAGHQAAQDPPAGRQAGAGARFWAALLSFESLSLTGRHLALVFGPLALAALVGIPLGVGASARPRLATPLLALVGILQTIPALALLALLIAATGRIGLLPALIALFVYALLPIISAAQSAISGIDRGLRESAVALGAGWVARTWHVELPAARSQILAGVRTAGVINVGGATLAAFVGAGGYGERIVAGLAVNDPALLLAGAIPAAALALLIQLGFGWLERRF